MQADNWAPEHCKALRDYLALGMSFAEIAREINAKFGTAYTRNATIGRSKRMGLATPRRPKRAAKPDVHKARKPRQPKMTEPLQPVATTAIVQERTAPAKLRCVGISPRLVSLVDLEASDCRYPYGGDKDNEPISFCGHPTLAGSCYCAPHFHLTRATEAQPERIIGPVVLRLVRAA
ncbi:GcrA family cell cycle regulator [Bradyrhizobium sp. ARR65]|uniref:GcrA family cell cycle regulator n=1 Tax=Bradyrhizobium sp. ARR65 TaxID=1040989 RepID=UPI000465F597|nr:GcrA family cell cycle regulator [Bradyrhizobium sp. ARR65]